MLAVELMGLGHSIVFDFELEFEVVFDEKSLVNSKRARRQAVNRIELRIELPVPFQLDSIW
jgi:hypothetical protein